MANNQKDIVNRFEAVKFEIDQSIKNLENKVAEIVLDEKTNSELNSDIEKLRSILNDVDENLTLFKNKLK